MSGAGKGIVQTCRQLHREYCSVLLKAALTPGFTTVAAVYNFDFNVLNAFIETLQPEEVAAANRNRNFVAQLFVKNVGRDEINNLGVWLDLCDRTGIKVGYVLHWTSFSLASFRCLEVVLQSHRERPKLWHSLSIPSVGTSSFLTA